MAKRNRLLIPEARAGLQKLKQDVMKNEGYQVNQADDVKFEVAKELGIPLQKGYNGHLEAKDAGSIGGKIGGNMVKEMIRMAQEQLRK
ncbi:alpha/beta-type small acid-soluble spore protein [Ammoniphilus sp. CFH 90114]|uniref:alpha/beta-type small acid-soluble spore protein n=1 Tax=Ammoniphilus sp. CFH 90114 TaxID=2493665 RepID=UPI00100F8823|nr:alpha/beta-type small acid-soluble spore protein [Ammoniphilus sp. CFH 90114]RXT13618.1 alpha/beta-type small acid-soluble spore protein [Ammoniphilus sp. CFH 90114]